MNEDMTPEKLRERLLETRGLDADSAESFLRPRYEDGLHDPFLLSGMARAVERVIDALARREKIAVYTDYDTDGIPAAVIWHDFFRKIGYQNFENYIPHRHREGFGVHPEAVTRLAEQGARLIITADCGITDGPAIARANERGIDVIVTDHHLPPAGSLPPAYAIINPRQGGDTYPFKDLCGAAVAFKLIQAVIAAGKERGIFTIAEGWEKWLLDMVGIATLSDMVPLVGENRILAHYGLAVLRRTRRKGLQELLRKVRVRPAALSEDDVGFLIAPRLNVASRMDSPQKAFALLATDNEAEAALLVNELEHLNSQRRGFVASIVKEAHGRLASSELPRVIVMGNTAWHPGVLGLAANTLVEEYARPVFLWGEGGDGMLKGSCRSNGSVHVVELMRRAEDALLAYGGHEQSGGFSVRREEVPRFAALLDAACVNVVPEPAPLSPIPDAALSFEHVREDVWGVIQEFAPFGIGNPKPLFLFESAEIRDVLWFGKLKNHLKLIFRDTYGREVAAIQFFAEGARDRFKAGQLINLRAHIERDAFGGKNKLRLRIVEVEERC